MEIEVYQQADELKDKHWWFLGRRRVISFVLGTYLKSNGNLKILDGGCGAATSLPILAPFGKIYGVDMAKEALKFCQNKGYRQLKQGEVTSLPFKDRNFNLVAALDLLEHVQNDRKALKELNRVCQNEGYLIITVPATPSLWGENDIVTHHFRRYQKNDLRKKIEESGFVIKKISYFNFFLFPLFLVWHFYCMIRNKVVKNNKLRSNLNIKTPFFINNLFTLLFSCESRFLPRVNFPWGLSLICLAQKK